jgi:hypothetical protein
MDKGINKEFVKLLEDPSVRFTVILGSGFHQQALGGNSVLSNWGILLSRLIHSKNLTGNYIADFEEIVYQQCKIKNIEKEESAAVVEKEEKNRIANFLKEEQKYVLSETNRFSYPDIFHSGRISDVVSLNFDTVPETMCCPTRSKPLKENSSSFRKVKNSGRESTSFATHITFYEKIEIPNRGAIRFWHPHGSIDKPENIVLGVAKFAQLASNTLRIRAHFKSSEVKGQCEQTNDLTWFSQIYNNPVIILGASMSEMEWAMWTAIVHRKRNFAKPSNRHCEKPIFKMMSPQDSKDKNKQGWFHPLFIDMKFEDQWAELVEYLKSET